jgi:hypothetical protein
MKQDLIVYMSDNNPCRILDAEWSSFIVEEGVLYVRSEETDEPAYEPTSYAFAKGQWRYLKVVENVEEA